MNWSKRNKKKRRLRSSALCVLSVTEWSMDGVIWVPRTSRRRHKVTGQRAWFRNEQHAVVPSIGRDPCPSFCEVRPQTHNWIDGYSTEQYSTVQYRTGLTLTVTATVVGFGFLLCCVSVPLYLSFLQFLPTNISLFFIGRIFLSDVSYYGISYQTPCMLEWR
jgi:hypothetical protein